MSRGGPIAAQARAVLRQHPRHVVLGALVLGLLAGAWSPVALVPAALLAAAAAGSAPAALVAILATLGGGLVAQARTHALTTGTLPARIGTDVALDVVLLEPLRERASGRLVARVAPVAGPARDEPLVLRLRTAAGLVSAPQSDASAVAEGERGTSAGSAATGAGGGAGGADSAAGGAADGYDAADAADADDAADGAAGGASGAVAAGGGEVVERTSLGAGDVLAVRGRLEALGEWDEYQRRRGAHATVEAERAVVTGRRRGGLAGALDGVRRRTEAAMRRDLPPPQAALLLGMTIGRDDGIDADTVDAFRASGLAHLLAVSGANVMLLCVLALALMGVVGVPLRVRLVVALALVALYVPLTGAGPSIQRAGVMGACGLVAALAGRPASRWYAVGFAAAVTLLLNPLSAADPGWQLSFAAVVGLLALAPPLRAALDRRKVPGPLAEAAAITVAATVATAPLLAAHFEQVSLASLPANLAVAPVVAPIMWLGALAAAVGQVAPALAAPLTALAAPLLGFVGWVAETAADLPAATIAVRMPGIVGVAAGYGLLALGALVVRRAVPAGWSPPRGPTLVAGLAAALALLALRADRAVAPARPGETVVSFLDVGQGDATLLQRDGAAVLVDTGTPEGGVLARLRTLGVRRLDMLVLTHAENDHEGAAPAVVRALRPRVVVNGGAGWPSPVQAALPALVRRAGGRVVRAFADDDLAVGELRLHVLWPPEALAQLPPEGSANDRALVMTASSGDLDVLLTADAEAEVTTGVDYPRVDALKVAHHGSDDAGLPALLDATRPAVAGIEVGADNTYGHPTPTTMRALDAAVPHVYRTDRDGTTRLFAEPDGTLRVERLGPAR